MLSRKITEIVNNTNIASVPKKSIRKNNRQKIRNKIETTREDIKG